MYKTGTQSVFGLSFHSFSLTHNIGHEVGTWCEQVTPKEKRPAKKGKTHMSWPGMGPDLRLPCGITDAPRQDLKPLSKKQWGEGQTLGAFVER